MKITRDDINFLFSLYRYRCLSIKQIGKFFYTSTGFYKEKIVPMINARLIDINNINGQYVISIRQEGIDLFQAYLNVPNEIYNAETGKNEKKILKKADVVVEDKFVNHQISLNDFVLEFKTKYDNFQYYDEKYLSGMKVIRPDGLIKIGKLDLFLEQDMGTESYKQLTDKWNRYKRFLLTRFSDDRKIVVLFIIKCSNIQERVSLVKRSIMDVFDQIDSAKFDIYIGDKNEMLEASFNRVIVGDKERTQRLARLLKIHNFKIDDGSKLKTKLGTIYKYYLAFYNKDKYLNYYNPNKKRIGKFTEFLCDNYDYAPISVLNKIYFHNKNSHNFDIAYSPRANLRLIDYLIVTEDIHALYKDLVDCELIGFNKIFFTTPERLRTKKFQQAIFSLTKTGDIMVCPDYYFEPTIREGNIKEYGKSGIKGVFR